MAIHQIQQIAAAEQLHESQLNQVLGEQRRDRPERKRAGHAVAEGFSLASLGQAEHEDRKDHRVVSAEEPFEGYQHCDGDEI